MLETRSFPKRDGVVDRRWTKLAVLAGWVLGASLSSHRDLSGGEVGKEEKPALRLQVFPPRVRLFGPEAVQRLVVVGVGNDGGRRDLTAEARLESRTPNRVKVEPDGAIRPVADGAGEIVVRSGTVETVVPVEVAQAAQPRDGQLPQRGRAAY